MTDFNFMTANKKDTLPSYLKSLFTINQNRHYSIVSNYVSIHNRLLYFLFIPIPKSLPKVNQYQKSKLNQSHQNRQIEKKENILGIPKVEKF